MLVMDNMDELMTMPLEEGWIAASHACTCNPFKLKHYPANWFVRSASLLLALLLTLRSLQGPGELRPHPCQPHPAHPPLTILQADPPSPQLGPRRSRAVSRQLRQDLRHTAVRRARPHVPIPRSGPPRRCVQGSLSATLVPLQRSQDSEELPPRHVARRGRQEHSLHFEEAMGAAPAHRRPQRFLASAVSGSSALSDSPTATDRAS